MEGLRRYRSVLFATLLFALFLEANREFNAGSPVVELSLAELYLKHGDNDKAVASLQKVLEKNPDDRRAKARLEELQKKP